MSIEVTLKPRTARSKLSRKDPAPKSSTALPTGIFDPKLGRVHLLGREWTMKPSRLTEEQITGILRRQEPGRRLPTLPQAWDQQSTFYEWQAKHGGLEVSDAKWLKVLEDENTK